MKDAKLISSLGDIANAKTSRERVPYFKKSTQGIATIVDFRVKQIEAFGGATIVLDVAIKTCDAQVPGAELSPVGSRCQQVFWVNNPEVTKGTRMKAEMAKRDVKGLLLAAIREREVPTEAFNEALGEALDPGTNLLRGVDVFYTTGLAGFPRFYAAPEQTSVQLADQRKELDRMHPVLP